jgi:hypothetical protein
MSALYTILRSKIDLNDSIKKVYLDIELRVNTDYLVTFII